MKTLQEKGLAHSLKKVSGGGKKRKKKEEAAEISVESTNGLGETSVKNSTPWNMAPVNGASSKSDATGINNSSTASLTEKVLREQELTKRRKKDNDNVRGLFSNRDQSKPHGKGSDFMSRGFSMPERI